MIEYGMKREVVAAALERAPALKPLLTRFARAAAKGKRLPESFSSKGIDYAAQRELDGLLHTVTARTADGAVYGSVLPPLREPSVWKELVELLLTDKERAPKAESVDAFFAKLKWRDPDGEEMIERLSKMPEVVGYLQRPENRKPWLDLYFGAVDMATHAEQGVKTLSQLGSDWLNDSKALRTGALRRQLGMILSAACDMDADAEHELFGGFGIVDNPYTSSVTVFAPFAFRLKDGTTLDFPAQMFDAGLACQLPLEVVDAIGDFGWRGDADLLRTSENAAPFATFVAKGIPSVYTEGYPNYAVQRLLEKFSRAGFEVEHWGDCDLDGFRIADLVSTRIPVRSVVASDILKNPGKIVGIPMTDDQRQRLTEFLVNHADFQYAEDLRRLLACGCWYEQEAFPL